MQDLVGEECVGCFPSRSTMTLDKLQWDPTLSPGCKMAKYFGEFLAEKMLRTAALFAIFVGKIVPGQTVAVAMVVPRVPGHFTCCPCGVGAYDFCRHEPRLL